MTAYADTSFVVSLYGTDPNAARAVREFKQSRPTFLITPFNELEFVTAFEAIVFRKIATSSEADASIRALEADLSAGVMRRHPVPSQAFARAVSLSRQFTKALGCRTLDILHVAIALELGATDFFTFDRTQAKLARRSGLPVRPRR